LKFFGENRIVFGSDAVWYGAPQWRDRGPLAVPDPRGVPRQRRRRGTRQQFGYPQLTETAKRKILGLNNARLYGIKDVNGRLSDENVCDDDDDRKHGHDDDHGKKSSYHPVPANYEALIPISLKKMLEFDKFAQDDNLSELRREVPGERRAAVEPAGTAGCAGGPSRAASLHSGGVGISPAPPSLLVRWGLDCGSTRRRQCGRYKAGTELTGRGRGQFPLERA
jgi:hypothetical protein